MLNVTVAQLIEDIFIRIEQPCLLRDAAEFGHGKAEPEGSAA